MKRENEDIPEGELQQQQQQLLEEIDGKDQKPPLKRPRSDEEEVRLLIPSKMAGAIIGKGGHNIQKLRTESLFVAGEILWKLGKRRLARCLQQLIFLFSVS
uniref:(northern house mosquito) hypothetical protein n=1 Tax=Culex pipiens TaxID=7175 RepID=A0A8D8B3M0_CULPI